MKYTIMCQTICWPSIKQAWRIKEDLRKVIYAILRCPVELLELMKVAGDLYKWEHGGGVEQSKEYTTWFRSVTNLT